jgi:hypothetical protein
MLSRGHYGHTGLQADAYRRQKLQAKTKLDASFVNSGA